jgi:hypothetical protein
MALSRDTKIGIVVAIVIAVGGASAAPWWWRYIATPGGHASHASTGSTLPDSTPPTSPAPRLSGPSPGSLPESFVGKWRGTALQYNTSQSYPVVLSFYSALIGSPVGTSTYPTLKCKGALRLRAVDGKKIFVTEYITENLNSACGTPDPLSLQLNKNGTLTYQELSGYTDFATVIGQATLRRS